MTKLLRIFGEFSDEIDTFESYRGDSHTVNNDIIIPFINVGISEHPLNESNQLNYIDYCYLVFKGVSSVILNANPKLLSGTEAKDKKLYYIGGTNIVSDKQQGEFEIECDNMYLVLKSDSKVSNHQWIPIDTPHFKPNLSKNEVQAFLKEELYYILNDITKPPFG